MTHSTIWVDKPSTIASRAAGSCFLKRSISGSVNWPAHARRQPDRDASDRLITIGAEVLARVSQELHDRHAVVEQPLAGVGQRDAAPVAKEELLGQLGLEAPHLPAEGGLRDIERQSRLAEATQLGNLDEVFSCLRFMVRGVLSSCTR